MKTFLTAAACVTLLSASSLFALADSIVSPRDPQGSLPYLANNLAVFRHG